MRELIARKPAAAVSPIVGGQALKGPAAKMLAELGMDASAVAVAGKYVSLLGGFVIDEQDAAQARDIEALGLKTLVTNTVMRNDDDRRRLAREMLDFALTLAPKG
jgi:LPPG:FO 2-phospho-L-lactate transferase